MESVPINALEVFRRSPDEFYASAFRYFQTIFAGTNGDVSQAQLPSYIPDDIYRDPAMLGCAFTAALVAMFERRAKSTDDWSKLSRSELLAYVALMPSGLVAQLDAVILNQGEVVGTLLFTSDLVMSRVLSWEREDYRKTKRWLAALDKAARIHQRKKKAPLKDPLLRGHKREALKQLNPAIRRLQEKFQKQRSAASPNAVLCAFFREASNPDLPFLSSDHNLRLWMDYCLKNPIPFLTESPANLFDGFVGFVTQHEPDYARKKISTR